MGEFERPCAAFASCAAEPCDNDAVTEVAHRPPGAVTWVPLCDEHRSALGVELLEYVVELHGFIPGGGA